VGEVQNHAGEEPGLCGTEQEADDQEACSTRHESREAGEDAPLDDGGRDPDPRTDLFQDQVAGNLEQEIAEEENAGAPAVDIGAEAEVLVHGQCGEGNVAAVDIGDAVGQRDQRKQPPGYFCNRSALDRLRILHVHEVFSRGLALVPRLLIADTVNFFGFVRTTDSKKRLISAYVVNACAARMRSALS